MRVIADIYKNSGTLNHAYIIEGSKSAIIRELLKFLEKEVGIQIKANPDFWYEEFEKFGVEEARLLKNFQSKKVLFGGRKVVVAVSSTFTDEAQNALLKTFEEPTPDTHFFIVTPSTESILPTLKSRVEIIQHTGVEDNTEEAGQFLKSSVPERFVMVSGMIENKDKDGAVTLLNNLEIELHKNGFQKYYFELKEIAKLRGYLRRRSPSVKMILEHISLILPKFR